ncbi:MAG: manganese efflux pump [Candidatus Peregrinibacteria bacterium]
MEYFWSSLLIAVSLAMDALSVSVSSGAAKGSHSIARGILIASVFGIFQWGMTVGGGLFGALIPDNFLAYGKIIAGLLVIFVGGKMIWECFGDEEKTPPFSFGWLFVAGFATSIDALGIGMSFALLQRPFWGASVIIGLMTFILCFLGYFLGKFLQKILGKKAEIFGGMVLVVIGGSFIFSVF